MRARRIVVQAIATMLLLAGCSGGDEDPSDQNGADSKRSAADVPLPAKKPAATGKIDSPVLKATWLTEAVPADLAAEGDLTLDDFVSGVLVGKKVIVTYAYDRISAVDVKTGKTAWQSTLNMDGGVICSASHPTTPDVSVMTVVHGSDGWCNQIATVSLKDGSVIDTVDVAVEADDSIVQLAPIATIGARDYYVDGSGVVRTTTAEGQIEKIATLPGEDVSRDQLVPVVGENLLVTLTEIDGEVDSVVGLTVPELTQAWSVPIKQVFPQMRAGSRPSIVPSDGKFLSVQGGADHTMVQIDPQTGLPQGQVVNAGTVDPTGASDELMLDVELYQGQQRFMSVGDDLVVNNTVRKLSRVAVSKGQIAWTFDGRELDLRDGIDDVFLQVGPVVAGGRSILASASNGHSMDLLLLSASTGKLQARWALPEKYAWGLADKPFIQAVDSGVVLVRDPESWNTGRQFDDVEPETGPVFDVGSFAWPAAKK